MSTKFVILIGDDIVNTIVTLRLCVLAIICQPKSVLLTLIMFYTGIFYHITFTSNGLTNPFVNCTYNFTSNNPVYRTVMYICTSDSPVYSTVHNISVGTSDSPVYSTVHICICASDSPVYCTVHIYVPLIVLCTVQLIYM